MSKESVFRVEMAFPCQRQRLTALDNEVRGTVMAMKREYCVVCNSNEVMSAVAG